MEITLRELDALSYEEIAAIMDCPVGTVRSRIFRGEGKLLITKFNRLSGVDDSGILDKGIRHAERTTFRFNGWQETLDE